jgi:hypothetical protein
LVSDLKKSSGNDRHVAGQRWSDVFLDRTIVFFFFTKTPSDFIGTRTDIAQAPPGNRPAPE